MAPSQGAGNMAADSNGDHRRPFDSTSQVARPMGRMESRGMQMQLLILVTTESTNPPV